MRYTRAMARGLMVWTLSALTAAAQPAADLYRTHCAGCHGPNGEGSRGPALKVAALDRASDVDSLVSLLRRGVPGTEMPATPVSTVNDTQLRALAAYVLAFRTTAPAAPTGPAGRGAELFRDKGKCLDCHRLNGEGKPLGPDLSNIGQQRDTNWLRRAITDPQADIYDSFQGYRWTISMPDNYLFVEAVTKSGERISGSRMNEDPFSIQIRDSAGAIRSLLKSELAELKKQWGKSPMPSYKDVFSAAELNDLVAYLASLRSAR
jgi:putative heme-binding domain-containing protein